MSKHSAQTLLLVKRALLLSFWFKRSLISFIRDCGFIPCDAEHFRSDSTYLKRDFIDNAFEELKQRGNADELLARISTELAKLNHYPDFIHMEDGAKKSGAAKQACSELHEHLKCLASVRASQEESRQRRARAQNERKQIMTHASSMESIKIEFEELLPRIGSSDAGRAFERWFGRLAEVCDFNYAPPYRDVAGREIDGSITISDTTYLLSLKFTAGKCDCGEISNFKDKLKTKSHLAQGLVISVSGFTKNAIDSGTGYETKLIYLDAQHLYAIFSQAIHFVDLIERIRRYTSRTGQPYLSVSEMSQTN